MLNQIVLVGRITKDVEVRETEGGRKVATLALAVPRNFKNINGEYETDFLYCSLWDVIATNTKEYCKVGDLVGIKGRVTSSQYEKDGEKRYAMDIIAEKVTFLSSKKQEETD